MGDEQDSWLAGIGVDVGGVLDSASGLVDDAKKTVVEAYDDTKKAAEETYDDVKKTAEETYDDAKKTVEETYDDVKKTAEETYDDAKKTVEDTVDDVKKTVEDTVDDVKKTVEDTVDDVKKTVEDTVDDVVETVEDVGKTLEDAVARFEPVINIPGLGDFDMAASLNQAANEVVANNTPPKLPFLQDAAELLAQASLILDENRTSEIGAVPLPKPTIGFSGKCCSLDDLQKFRAGIEAPRNGLQSAVNAYNDTQRAIEDAAEQGKRICYGGLATCIAGSVISPGGGGVAACLAGAIACIGGTAPVQNAIRTQIKAKADVEVANGALGRALANHQNCFFHLCPSDGNALPATPSLKKPGDPVDLGEIDDPKD